MIFSSGDGTFDFDGDVLASAFDLEIPTRENVLDYVGGYVQLGHASVDVNLIGNSARPFYGGSEIALLSDMTGTFVDGSGITFTDLGGGVNEISITAAGINISHMPAGDNGQYSRISSGGLLVWDDLDIVAGTGMVAATDPVTKQVTVSIDDLGVDTDQLADAAVTTDKIDDDAVDYTQINSDRTAPDAVAGLYTLIVETDGIGGGELQWQKGGAAGVLGTIDRLEAASVANSSDVTDVQVLAGSVGPYMLHYVELEDLIVGRSGVLTVTIDGTNVIDEETFTSTEALVIANDADAQFDFPYFAKESFEVKFRRTGSAGTIHCSAKAVLMG